MELEADFAVYPAMSELAVNKHSTLTNPIQTLDCVTEDKKPPSRHYLTIKSVEGVEPVAYLRQYKHFEHFVAIS